MASSGHPGGPSSNPSRLVRNMPKKWTKPAKKLVARNLCHFDGYGFSVSNVQNFIGDSSTYANYASTDSNEMLQTWAPIAGRNDPMISDSCDDGIMPYDFEMYNFASSASRVSSIPTTEEDGGPSPKRARTVDSNFDHQDTGNTSPYGSYGSYVSVGSISVCPSLDTAYSAGTVSACPTLSPVGLDSSPYLEGLRPSGPTRRSRGPSPLQHFERLPVSDCSGPDAMNQLPYQNVALNDVTHEPEQCNDPCIDEELGPKDQSVKKVDVVQAEPVHICNWSGCSVGTFESREGLNWHVKEEHLLICPVLGCCESNFTSKAVVKAHICVAHGGKSADSQAVKMEDGQKHSSPRQSRQGHTKGYNNEGLGINQKAKASAEIKQTSDNREDVEAVKLRCREQLGRIMAKRAARQQRTSNTIDVNSANPGSAALDRSQIQPEVPSFPLLWEHCILPFLVEFLQTQCGPGHVISVCKGDKGQNPNARRICFMTRDDMSPATKDSIKEYVRDLLPPLYEPHATFEFSRGQVERLLALARGLSHEHPDDVCLPRNPFCYLEPCMGDSIGAADDEFISTLGPSLVVDGANVWLANFHPFVDVCSEQENVSIEHPSSADRELCRNEGHDAMVIPPGGSSFKLGTVTATSGFDLKTVRVSHDPYWEEMDLEPPLVVTDWSLISSNRPRQVNMLRRLPAAESVPVQRGSITADETVRNVPVISTGSVIPGGTVITTGRSSGHQHGEICEIPAYLSSGDSANGTGYATREWFIQEPASLDDEDAWIRGGVGIKGDSGAAVVNAESNELIGQLWGRNQYWGTGPRHAFFTPIADIFDDIHEKCRQQTRPKLPQFQGDWDREYVPFAVYPTCMRCFERAAYLGTSSRRSSQASLCMNVDGGESTSLPALEGGVSAVTHGHARDDVTSSLSISEAITPIDMFASPRDTGIHALLKTAGSPAAAKVRIKYPATIEDDDLSNVIRPA